ncbi:hypothetical protein EST92_26470 [Streptomyces sp. TM32]|uniref:hypothetical protein n=1 Tax=Streptomyces sp. TM32 TaxID=1652669 RepID=UPI0010124CFF|nr:hypothetical protein [Streptomyces sp. TM32]RXS68653.1 hypothetical protein EST92_26470 [Streptomyces sp. TM32]
MAEFREPAGRTPPSPRPGAPRPGNVTGKAAVILGSIGLIVAFVVGIIGPSAQPTRILFWVAGLLTFVALVLGLVGPWRAKRGRATHLQQSLTGAVSPGRGHGEEASWSGPVPRTRRT